MMHPDIESYLNGELSGEALEQFRLELAQNPAMQHELDRLKPVWHVLRRAGIGKKIEEVIAQRARRRRRQRLLIIGIIGMIFIVLLYWKNRPPAVKNDYYLPGVQDTDSRQLSPKVLPQDTATEKKPTLTPHPQVNNNTSETRMIALNFYRKYPARSASLLRGERSAMDTSQQTPTDLQIPEKRLQQAGILFEQGQYTQAKAAFMDLSKKYPAYKDAGEWYVLLSALAELPPDVKTARRVATRIMTDPDHHTYMKETQELVSNYLIMNLLK